MRQTDFDFAMNLLTQAGLQPEELASSWTRVLAVDLAGEAPIAWVFNNEGELLRFDSPFLFTKVDE
jgi:hypothetical protein